MILSIIVACTENNVIGRDNDMPWHLPADLKHFKSLTTGNPIIMGRKTYESIGRPLPKRRNLIITRNASYTAEGIEIYQSLEQAVENCQQERESFIIGGGQIYNCALEMADRIYLTRIHTEIDGDTFFPELKMDKWKLVDDQFVHRDDKNEHDMSFQTYEKTIQ